jgi:putative FmdB family regulatory protein
MPTYDYRCAACGHAFEKFHSMTADPIRDCPDCGKAEVKRLIGTGAGIIFKGGGFYETDYRSDSYTKDAKKDSGDTGSDKKGDKGDKGETSKPDTSKADKPEKKAEPVAKETPAPAPKTSDKAATS